MFPIAIPDLSYIAAFILTPNSGKEVPNATTVSPITNFDIFNFEAICTEDFIIQSAPKKRNPEPPIRHKILIVILNINYIY